MKAKQRASRERDRASRLRDRLPRPPRLREPGRPLSPSRLFRVRYGASPFHLLVLLASFALCGYAAAKLLDGNRLGIVEWFVGAAVIHDLVLVPLYGGTDWVLHRALRAGGDASRRPGGPRSGARLAVLNHLRVPAFLSLLLLLVYWPSISQDAGPHYRAATLLSPGVFADRWLLITAVLFGASGLLLCVRLWRAGGHRASRPRAARPPHRPQT
jgi:hypothetical protein